MKLYPHLASPSFYTRGFYALFLCSALLLTNIKCALGTVESDASDVAGRAFDEAEKRFFAGDFTTALEKYNKILQQYPSFNRSDAVLYKKAMTQLRLEDYDASIATFDQLLHYDPRSAFASSAMQNKDIINTLIKNKDQYIAEQLRQSGAPEDAVKTLTNIQNRISTIESLKVKPSKVPPLPSRQGADLQQTKNRISLALTVALVFFLVSVVVYYYYRRQRMHHFQRKRA